MAKRNLTVQLDEGVIRRAKILAAKEGTSVSALVARDIERMVDDDERYERSREVALSALGRASPRGGRAWRREELYSR